MRTALTAAASLEMAWEEPDREPEDSKQNEQNVDRFELRVAPAFWLSGRCPKRNS
jgi:hypothetical protein